ncbi:MAG: beta-lactamase family protein, partial [Anaerolineae bacterium]|nr:beta-lactamase family protein [Anaerolineae bacterium]
MDINIIPPESVGFSSTRLERIHPAMQGYVNKGHPPGIITVVARQGKVVHYECFGLRDVGAGQPMRPDTILRIYSMTKPITAVALMILLEEGRFVLGEPVSKTIPEFKRFKVYAGGAQGSLKLADLEREITILDLLTHTSGLAYGIFPSSPVEALYHAANLNNATSASEFIRRLVELPLAHQPGTAWRYGFAYEVLGHLISIWTDQPFDVFLQERVLGPLGMDDTGFCVPENKLACFAAQYTVTESGDLALTDPPSAASQFARADKPPSGGGGLVSTAADYLRFAQMLLDGG